MAYVLYEEWKLYPPEYQPPGEYDADAYVKAIACIALGIPNILKGTTCFIPNENMQFFHVSKDHEVDYRLDTPIDGVEKEFLTIPVGAFRSFYVSLSASHWWTRIYYHEASNVVLYSQIKYESDKKYWVEYTNEKKEREEKEAKKKQEELNAKKRNPIFADTTFNGNLLNKGNILSGGQDLCKIEKT